jgi:uncharacterized membrane-anchored protein YhcB (DUF1043 family)
LLDPEADPAELLAEEPEEVEKPETAEPSFEVEIDGKPEVITGSERVKELLARGLKAGRGFEENARVREALQAHVQQAQLKLKEQRDQLREQRAAAFQNLNAKQQQFQAHMEQGAQKLLAAESEALLAKVPAWRNAEKAAQEKGEIGSALLSHYGFTQAEVGQIRDHRMLLVARDAAAYRKLLANKDARVKQAREAPATAKPGAASAQPNGRVEFTKVRGKIRELGTKGNHRAQENLAIQMFERAFK